MEATPAQARRPHPARALRHPRVIAAAVAVWVLTVLGAGAQPTSAAWTDPVTVTAAASSGSWLVAGAPILPGPGVSVSYTWSVSPISSSGAQVCATVTVSTTSVTPVPWSFDLDLSAPPWNGATSGYSENQGATVAYVGNDRYRVSGTADWILVSAGHPRVDTVCNYGLPPIPAPSSTGFFTVRTVPASGADWTSRRACLVTTVTGDGAQQFPFGWTVPLDISPALAVVGPAASGVQATTNAWAVTVTPALSPQQSTYSVAGTWASAITGTGSFSFTTCVVRY